MGAVVVGELLNVFQNSAGNTSTTEKLQKRKRL